MKTSPVPANWTYRAASGVCSDDYLLVILRTNLDEETVVEKLVAQGFAVGTVKRFIESWQEMAGRDLALKNQSKNKPSSVKSVVKKS